MNDEPVIKIYGATVDRIEVVTGPDTWAVTVDDLLALKAEVERLRKKPERVEWVYAIRYAPRLDGWQIRIGPEAASWLNKLHYTMEQAIQETAKCGAFPDPDHTPPAFGVRRLTEGEIARAMHTDVTTFEQTLIRYGAFRDGNYLICSYAVGPEQCIQSVLIALKPAVTLADLPACEVTK